MGAITKPQLQARAAFLQRQAEKLQNDLNATLGALQDCNFWLDQLSQPELPHEDGVLVNAL